VVLKALPHLEMEGMTMVFHVPAGAMAGLKVGDRVRFKAHKEGAKLVIDAIEHAH
jgi:Cu/Ag efflux protein CusF